ncbi:hypothetical protein SUDANB105_00483 [Streptomyces sp. enrichment culture]
MLRRWWEQSARDGSEKPTQESLSKRLGVDQTTLSRYLNPRHGSNAPLHVVELLHSHLRAPVDDLDRARALHAAAVAGSANRRGARPAPSAGAPTAPRDTVTSAEPQPVPADEAHGAPRRGTRWGRAVAWPLVATASVLLLAGLGVWWANMNADPDADSARVTREAAEKLSATGPAAVPRWPLVQEGDRFWTVRTVQFLLVAHGHRVEVDGRFGRRTAAAVKAFQADHALLADGVVGPKTWPLLVSEVDARSAGSDVEALQFLLDNAGLPTDITGAFSAATARNLASFQESHGLPATGEADVPTWRALMAAQAPTLRTRPS